MAKFVAALGVLARDGAGLLGAGLISFGAWLAYPAAGFVVAGTFLLGGAWLMARDR
jgi:hypothetical protein